MTNCVLLKSIVKIVISNRDINYMRSHIWSKALFGALIFGGNYIRRGGRSKFGGYFMFQDFPTAPADN